MIFANYIIALLPSTFNSFTKYILDNRHQLEYNSLKKRGAIMEFKIMSFNLRVPAEADGINHFDNRKQLVLATIEKEQPDLIGFQEAPDSTRAFLRANLPSNYTLLGCGRKAGYRGESAPLAYRNDKFELIAFDTFWLSDTPSVPESRYENSDQSHCPRLTFHAVLHAEACEQPIHFYNTHLDHKGKEARTLGMRDIIRHIKKQDGTFILTGDMNATPDEQCIKEILAEPCIIDATANIPSTFHAFGKREDEYKIDYIFTNGKSINACAVDDPHENGIYISDHYPICAILDL